MRAIEACAALALTVALVGCGRDPVRADLERYAGVLGEVERAERETARDLEPVLERLSGARLAAPDARKIYAGALAPRYERLVRDVLTPFAPATGELDVLHRRVLDHYRKVHAAVQSAAAAFAKPDWAAADDAHEALGKLAFDPLRAEISTLAEKHGLKLVQPAR